ncbi:hypothetical protein AVEN_103116-1 [Araneus ventricosus]|uniref:Uncharacterized protein n=1 Tax=Araneus ventricosus TaxID=182803 RepID=A0A4Y2HUU2_ARAVE|nr:hypothetical protein AVEN_103116-1 [Araneus ventricosus]
MGRLIASEGKKDSNSTMGTMNLPSILENIGRHLSVLSFNVCSQDNYYSMVRPEIMFVTAQPFPTYLKKVNIRNSDSCGYENLETPHTMLKIACLQYLTT